MQTTTVEARPEVVHAFVQEYLDAWKGTDKDKILAYYRDDVVLQLPTGTLEGKAEVRDNFVRPFIGAFPGNLHAIRNLVHATNLVAVEWNFEAMHRSLRQHPGNRQASSGSGLLVLRIRSQYKGDYGGTNILRSWHSVAADWHSCLEENSLCSRDVSQLRSVNLSNQDFEVSELLLSEVELPVPIEPRSSQRRVTGSVLTNAGVATDERTGVSVAIRRLFVTNR